MIGIGLAIAACSDKTIRLPREEVCDLGEFDPQGTISAGLADIEITLLGRQMTRPVKIPNGRWVTPLGTTIRLHSFPIRVAAHPNGRYYAVGNNGLGDMEKPGGGLAQSISIVDAVTAKPLTIVNDCGPQTDPLGGNPGAKWICAARNYVTAATDAIIAEQLFGDLVFNRDGTRLYAAGGGANEVYEFDTSTITAPTVLRRIPVPHYPTGLALTPDGRWLLATGFHRHALHRIDLATGTLVQTYAVQIYPFGVTTDGSFAYVSNLGANSVSKIDLATGNTVHLLVGRNPQGVVLTPDGKTLYVANSDSDTVSIIDTAVFTPDGVRTIDLRETPISPPGKSPVDVQLSRDGSRLYIVLAGDNAVAVVRTSDLMPLGSIPTAWYPQSMVESPDGKEIAIVSAKGYGAGQNDPFQWGRTDPYDDIFVGRIQKGTLSLAPTPSDADLLELSQAVERNNNLARHLFRPKCDRVKGPVPLKVGQPSPIKHVVYIVRENKTYDSLLGDYPGKANSANGKPELAIWGKSITPNLHALAERFAGHDNYYSEPEQSVQGHIWAANGWSNDFSEKVWMGMWANKHDALFLPAIEHASRGGNDGLIFNILKAGRDVRIYGEISGTIDRATSQLRDKFNWKYPAWSLHIRDRDKAKIFIEDLNQGIFPDFVYIWLPNDHTSGCAVGRPYPVSEIMDNDEGTGMIVDAISKSKFWKETVIFIFEDDPQSAPDHIDGHRSILQVVSPYAKRGYTSHVVVSFPSIHRTMGLILGVPPTSRYEELATPLYDVFQEEPDLEPFNYIPLPDDRFRIASLDDPETITIGNEKFLNCTAVAKKFLTADALERPDQILGLGRILWYHRMGNAPYPTALINESEGEGD